MEITGRPKVVAYHSDGRRSQYFGRRQGRVERHVGHDVDERHQNQRYGDGFRQIPVHDRIAFGSVSINDHFHRVSFQVSSLKIFRLTS